MRKTGKSWLPRGAGSYLFTLFPLAARRRLLFFLHCPACREAPALIFSHFPACRETPALILSPFPADSAFFITLSESFGASRCTDNVLNVHLDVLFYIEMYATPRFRTFRCTSFEELLQCAGIDMQLAGYPFGIHSVLVSEQHCQTASVIGAQLIERTRLEGRP